MCPCKPKALLRFRLTGVNDFDDPKPVSSATIVALDCDTHGLEAKRPVQAVSEARALVVIASDPSQLQGCLAHFPMLRIGEPGRDFVLAVMADVRSAGEQLAQPCRKSRS